MLLGFLLFPAIGLLAGAMIVALCIMAIWRTITVPPEVSRATSCGGCGHEIAVLGAGRCPECGGDLIRVGLATRRMAVTLRGSLLMAIMAWTILVGVAAVVVGYTIFVTMMMSTFAGGTGLSTTMSGTITPTPTTTAARSAPNYSIAYSLNSTAGGAGVAGSLSLDLSGPGGTAATATIDLSDTSYTIFDSQGIQTDAGAAFNAAASERFYLAAGLTPAADATLAAEKDELALWARDASRQPYTFGQNSMFGAAPATPSPLTANLTTVTNSGMPFGGGVGGSTELIATAAGLLLTALIYVLGIAFIVRRRNKLLRG